jgi:hypothetical protein
LDDHEKSDPVRAAVTTRTAHNLVSLCAAAAWCISPMLAHRVLTAFGGSPMRRRDFIAGIDGTAAWPLVAGAQQPAKGAPAKKRHSKS